MILDGLAAVIFDPVCLIWIFISVIVGTIFGSIPGLTATMAIAMFLPVTYNMSAIVSVSILMGLYIGGISGGLIPAILLNIPGTPASIATCFDGTPMANKGLAGKALGTGIVFSFLGTILSVVALIVFSPPLAEIAIKFGPFEYFAITVFSLTLISSLSGDKVTKGLIAGVLGLMLATIGMAPIDSVTRYTFSLSDLRSGFDILIVLVGVYAIPEVLLQAENVYSNTKKSISMDSAKIKGFGITLKEFIGQIPNFIRSSIIGIGLGILPGIGNGTSNILAYSVAKNQSKYPEKFGTGIIDGLVASEGANNATIGGTIIPLLTLGIPGDSTAALLLGALVIKGITPGPLIFEQNGEIIYAIFGAMVLASIFMLIIQFFGIRYIVKILNIPKNYLLSMVFALCAVGAYGMNNRVFDIFCLLVFGIIGYLLNKAEYPLAPLILGFVLGPILELNLRRALSYSQGSFVPLFTSPISMFFIVVTIVSVVISIVKSYKKSKQA